MVDWLVCKGEEQIEATPLQIRRWLDAGEIDTQTRVYLAGSPDWVSLGSVIPSSTIIAPTY